MNPEDHVQYRNVLSVSILAKISPRGSAAMIRMAAANQDAAVERDIIPIGVIFAALLFGTLQVGGTALGHSTDAPASVIDVMLGFVMLFVLMSFFVRKKLEIRSMKKQKLQKGEV